MARASASQKLKKPGWADDVDAMRGAYTQQVPVECHDVFGLALESRGEKHIVGGILSDMANDVQVVGDQCLQFALVLWLTVTQCLAQGISSPVIDLPCLLR